MNPIPLTLVIGPLGAGKTTLLTQLISHRSEQERWGVLVNDFGTVGIDSALLSGSGLVVESLSGGCVCCSLQAIVVQALEKLRVAGVSRIWLEPSGVADARSLYLILRKISFIRLLPIVAVLPASLLLAKKVSPLLRAQLALASYVSVSHADNADTEQQKQITELMNGLYPAKMDWVIGEVDAVPESWLVGLGVSVPLSLLKKGMVSAALETGNITISHFEKQEQDGLFSAGMVYPFDHQWSRPCLVKALAACDMVGVQRAKGIVHTGPTHWYRFDWTRYCGWQWQESDYTGESRFEVLYSGQESDWQGIFEGCRYRK